MPKRKIYILSFIHAYRDPSFIDEMSEIGHFVEKI
jgi:hypothetical protein